jgi:hypothetical protein
MCIAPLQGDAMMPHPAWKHCSGYIYISLIVVLLPVCFHQLLISAGFFQHVPVQEDGCGHG